MAGVVAVDFRIGGHDAVQRAIQTVTRSTERAAREQAKARQSGDQAAAKGAKEATKANAQRLTEEVSQEQAAALAKKKAITDVNRHRVSEARKAIETEADLYRKAFKEQVAAARQATRDKAAGDREATRTVQATRRSWLGGIGDGEKGSYSGAIGRGVNQGARAIAAPVLMAGMGAGLGAAGSAIEAQIDLNQRAALMQNATGQNIDFTKIAKTVSSTFGVDAGEVMSGFEKLGGKAGGAGFEALGKGPEAMVQTLTELGGIARAAGVSMADLGDVVGTLVNRGAKGKEIVDVVRGLVQQGKDGAVEFKDLATMLDESSGALLKFNMGTRERLTSAGGLSQIARTFGSKSAAEATTAVKALARDVAGKGDVIQGLTGGKVTGAKVIGGKVVKQLGGGVEIGTDASRSQMRDINVLLPEIIEGAIKAGNVSKLFGPGGVFTDESSTIAQPLVQAATQGVKMGDDGKYRIVDKAKGEQADAIGQAAMAAMLRQFEQAAADEGATRKDLANVMKQDGAQLSLALNKLKNDLGDQLAPSVAKLTTELTRLAPEVGKAGGAIVSAITTAIEYPLGAVAGVLGASVLKQVVSQFAANRIAAMSVQAAVVNMSGGTPGVPGGTPGAPGTPGTPTAPLPASASANTGKLVTSASPVLAALGVIGAGVAGFLGGIEAGDDKLAEFKKDDATRFERAATATDLASKIRTGKASPEDIEAARALTKTIANDMDPGTATDMWKKHMAKPWQELGKGNITLGNAAGALVSPVMGALGAMGELDSKANDTNTAEALHELNAALAGPLKLADGTSVTVSNLADLKVEVKTVARDNRAQPVNGS